MSAPSESLPKAAATPPATRSVHAGPPFVAPDFEAALLDFVKSMCESATKQGAPQTPQQQRRRILQATKEQVIDRYRPSSGTVTESMRGAAKMLIERELVSLPLEELPFEEVCEMAGAIRDRLYAMTFRQQTREADRLRVEDETRQKKEVEILGALLRADRRKKTFIQQANHQAHAYCQEKAIIGVTHLSVLADVESRLEVFLIGDEPIVEAQAIVQSVVATRIAEAEAILAAAQAKANEKWREEMTVGLVLGAVVGLVVLSLKYPEQTLAIFNWFERTFGYTPGAHAGAPNPETMKTSPSAANTEARPRSKRRRKDPVSPSNPDPLWGSSAAEAPGHA